MKVTNLNLTILIITYLSEYSLMEKNIKILFEKYINDIKEEKKKTLYYLYGVIDTSSAFQYDFVKSKISMSSLIYENDSKFSKLNLKKIIDVIYSYNVFNDFPTTIESFQTQRTDYKMKDVFKKLALLRNVLAHETGYINLSKSYEIESFSKANLKKYLTETIEESDIEKFEDNEMIIASNLLYVRKISDLLKIKYSKDD